jgi:hypothetical protein
MPAHRRCEQFNSRVFDHRKITISACLTTQKSIFTTGCHNYQHKTVKTWSNKVIGVFEAFWWLTTWFAGRCAVDRL